MRKIINLQTQSGFTLLEAIAALAVMGAAVMGIYSLTEQSVKDTKGSITAMHLKTIGDAANEYVRMNYAAVTANATATTPALIRVSDLIAAGRLPTGYKVSNPENQNTCVLVLEPTSNNLTALVVTEGGNTLADINLGQIAATIGGSGGGIYSTDTSKIQGSMGGWEFAPGSFSNANHLGQKCDGSGGSVSFTVGHLVMALWFADGSAVSATLYRDSVPGNPSLNTMNTPIIMGATRTEGSACTTDPNGSIARSPNGTVISCVSGVWRRSGGGFWEDPVATFAALPTTDATGTVRMTTDTARAFMWNGATWTPLSVDQNGDMFVPRDLAAGRDVRANRHLTVGGDSFVAGSSSVSGNSTVLGNSVVGSNMTIGGVTQAYGAVNTTDDFKGQRLKLDAVNVAGLGCSPNGMLSRTSTGSLLTCISGIWRTAGGGGPPSYAWWGGGYVSMAYGGEYVFCPPGEYVRGFMLNVPSGTVPFLGGYGNYVVAWRVGCTPASSTSAWCSNVYTPGQWDNWNWGNNYDFGGALVCSP